MDRDFKIIVSNIEVTPLIFEGSFSDYEESGRWLVSQDPNDRYSALSQLGGATQIPEKPEKAVVERVENSQREVDYVIRFTCPEFTSLCPMTGQPDFAHIVIDYIPDKWLVESKSLKLFLVSFRNHGAFHEDCTINIAQRLVSTLSPRWLRIGGYWFPRGGIPIDIFYQTGPAPENVWLPDQGVQPYRGRG